MAGGGRMHTSLGLVKNSFTRAELLAISAVTNMGAMAYCSDCAALGGAQVVFARGTVGGTPATDWVTVGTLLAI